MKNTGCPDKPVASISEDLFNVSTYVNGLCSFIRSCDTPMTISIQGDWGSGKTSMMNMMRENLQGSIWPIWFNTWQFSQFDMGNGLAFSMMDVLLKGLDCDKEFRKKLLNGLVGFGKKVVKVATDHAVGGELAGTVGELMDGGDSDYASEILELKNKFQHAVDEKLSKEHRDRVVVFVDDLDRLQPIKAVELLEVLKLFLDCENCIFILAVDYEVVTLGIKQKFGEDVSDVKGKSFFDKIIQLPFKMPVAQYDIHKYVKDMMDRMNISTDDKNVQLFSNLIQTSMGFNPRSMKRLFNTYELLDIITKATVRGIDEAVRKRILFAIICTQMSFEELYLYLTSTRIDADTFTALVKQETLKNALDEIYSGKNVSDELIHKISLFMPYFIDALQIDEDEALSEDEIENLKIILKCSVVTSVNASAEENDSESKEWEYRDINKNLVKKTAELLKPVGTFNAWMPRKARDGVKISDISGYHGWTTTAGFDCILEYYLSRIDDYTIGVHLYVSQENTNGETFFGTLGDNPLKLSINPVKVEWGRYMYRNVLRLNENDPNSTQQIASIVKNAYETLMGVLGSPA